MESINFDNDIKVLYIMATSFPDGILSAHQKLHTLVPYSSDRKYFGLSRPENGTIVYKAAAEEIIEGEAEKINCDTLILKKGKYLALTVNNYMEDIPRIGKSFTELLSVPGLDPEGYCVEWYVTDKDVKCMVRLME